MTAPNADSALAERYLIEAQGAGMIGDDDWQASADRAYFLVNFGDGQGVVEFTATEILAKLDPDAGFFNRVQIDSSGNV